MQWTPVDLETIARILDELSAPQLRHSYQFAVRMRKVLDGDGVDPEDPDNPQVDADGIEALSYAVQFGQIRGTDAANALESCLQYPLLDPTHGG